MRVKRVLFLSLFYPPDLSAGSFRTSALVAAIAASSRNLQLDVFTAQPHRYNACSAEAESVERESGILVRRVQLPDHHGGLLRQVLAFVYYARAALTFVRGRDYDLVIATSSRLMTAVLGAFIAARKGARLYLDIRDILVETLAGIFRAPLWRPLIWGLGLLERWALARADRVNLVSRGFLPYFLQRYPGKSFSTFSNGVDREFGTLDARQCPVDGPLKVLYAGNIGDGQGLHSILPALAAALDGRVMFQIIGDGGRSEVLRERLYEVGVGNVQLLPPLPREQLLAYYRQADVLFLHLNDMPAFRRVLPSKLFEYAATGKPIWAGVAGYAAEFIAAELTNTEVFAPCDAEAALESFERLSLGVTDRAAFIQRYERARIMTEMTQDILQLLEPA